MSVNFGNFKALLTPASPDDANQDKAPDAEGTAFAGRLTRAMVPSPLPSAAPSANLLTKGVPLVDVTALDALPMQPHVACAPRFWEAADLVTKRAGVDEEAVPGLEAAQDATSKQSSDERRQQQSLYAPENAAAPAVAAPPQTSSQRHAPSAATSPRPPTAKAPPEKPSETPKARPPQPTGLLGQPAASNAAATAPVKTTAAPPLATPVQPPALTPAASAPAPATKTQPLRVAAALVATRPTARDDVEATRNAARPSVDSPGSSGVASSPSTTAAPRSTSLATASAEPSMSSRQATAPSDHASELPLSQVQWSKGEARVSLQTDAGALSLHVRVRDGVADVAASGPAAARLEGKSKELTAQLAKEGLALGRFAAVDLHAAAVLLGGTIEDEGESTSCQEPDEDDGTGSADAGDKRRVSGERRRLRPQRRVHVKA